MDNKKPPTELKLDARDVRTEPVRIAFPKLFELAPTYKGSDKLAYSVVLLIPPDYDLAPWNAAAKAAMIAKFGKVVPLKPDKNPIKSTEGSYWDDLTGWRYCNASAYTKRPGILNRSCELVTDPSQIYSGMWMRFHLRAWAYDHPTGGRGLGFGLESGQIVRDDDPFVKSVDPRSVFGPIDGGDAGANADTADDLFA